MIDYNKLIESIHYIVCWHFRTKCDQYKVLKTLYFADKWSWVERKHAIANETYVAMKAGPVASCAYNLIKKETQNSKAQQLFDKKIKVTAFPADDGDAVRRDLLSIAPFVKEFLSEDDTDFLRNSARQCLSMSGSELWEITHEEKIWDKAWKQAQASDKPSESIDFEGINRAEELSAKYPDLPDNLIKEILDTKDDNLDLTLADIKDILLARQEIADGKGKLLDYEFS